MRLIVLFIVVFLALAPLIGGAQGAGIMTFGPIAGGALLLTLGVLLTTNRWMGGKGTTSILAEDRLYLARIILTGFFVRVLIAAVLRVTELNGVIAPDEGTFHGTATVFCRWLAGESPYRLPYRYMDTLQVGYFYLLGTIYHVFGVEPFLPVLLNCFVGAVTAIPVFRIARDLGGRDAARSAALLVTFFPSLVLWSTLMIRDSLVILSVLSIIWLVMELRRSFRITRLLLLLLAFLVLGSLRQYIFLLVAVCAILAFLVGRSGRSGRTVLISFAALIGLFVIVKGAGFGMVELERASLDSLNLHRQYNATEGHAGSMLPQVDISEPANAITYLPVGMVYFLGSPFPWQLFSPRLAMTLPDIVLWYMLLPPIFLGIVRVVRTRFRDAAMLLFSIASITMIYSLVEGNVGIIFRHRAQVIAPLMVFAGIGLAVRRERRETASTVSTASPASVPAHAGSSA